MAADPAPIYEVLRDALQADEPVALATITEGPGTGAKLLVKPGQPALGTLGDGELDRVVARDALAELDVGLTSTRHYGQHGEARERDIGPGDAVCVLTHDAKFDVPAIVSATNTAVGYIGAMGSRRTHTTRMARLRDAGLDDAALERVMAPIGLDIGARTPEETAISICGEIIALRTGRADLVAPLRDASGPIH